MISCIEMISQWVGTLSLTVVGLIPGRSNDPVIPANIGEVDIEAMSPTIVLLPLSSTVMRRFPFLMVMFGRTLGCRACVVVT